MELTAAGEGTAAIAVLLALLSLLLADATIAYISLVLILFLLIRLLLFRHACSTLAKGLRVRRTVDGEITRQGRIVSVRVEVEVPEVPLRMEYTDLQPENAVIVGGLQSALLRRGGITLGYRMQPLVPGLWPFRGISLELRDAFFSHGAVLSFPRFKRPDMMVYPAAEAAASQAEILEREIEQPFGLKGPTVHSFREFLPGDNPRFIDWKLTAKHGKTYVREMHTLTGAPPVVVIDAPAPLHASREEGRALLEEAGALVAGIHGAEGSCTLLVCAGPNLVHCLVNEEDLGSLLSALGDALGVRQGTFLFRERGAEEVAERAARVEAALGATGERNCRTHLERLAAKMRVVAEAKGVHAFGEEFHRALAPFAGSGVHLFHMGKGDQSHILCLKRLCSALGCTLVERVPPAGGRASVAEAAA